MPGPRLHRARDRGVHRVAEGFVRCHVIGGQALLRADRRGLCPGSAAAQTELEGGSNRLANNGQTQVVKLKTDQKGNEFSQPSRKRQPAQTGKIFTKFYG